MKLGIMQPYFFPYIGYFSLIFRTDKWVVFDTTQYTPKTWMNRNRILKPHKSLGWQYITVPLKNSSISTKIYQAEILNRQESMIKILAQIEHYRKKAPFFDNVYKIVKDSFDNIENDSLVDLNLESLKAVCKYLKIPFNYMVYSKSLQTLKKDLSAGEWALEISSELNATEYINPIGGCDLFSIEEFERRNIKISFLNSPKFEYKCYPYQFIENLSIIDVLMWNSPESVRLAL